MHPSADLWHPANASPGLAYYRQDIQHNIV